MGSEFTALHGILAFFHESLVSSGADVLGSALTEAEIDAFEKKYSFRLPYILREFYLSHNGMGEKISRGSPHHNIAPLQSLGEVGGALRNTLWNHAHDTQNERRLKKSEQSLFEPEPPDSLFAVGMDASGDVYFLDLRVRTGQGIPVFLLHHDAAFEVDQVADSFEEFVFEFLEKELGLPEGKRAPAMPLRRGKKSEPTALVREALPLIEPTAAEPEPSLPFSEPRILSELGSTNWRHSSAPEGGMGGIRSGFFTSDGQLVTLGQDAQIHAWNMENGTIERSFEIGPCEPERILLSPDQSKLAVLWREEYDSVTIETVLLNFADGKELCRFESDSLRDLHFSPDSSECIALTKGGVFFHDAATGRRKREIKFKKPAANRLAISADGKCLVTDSEGCFPLIVRDGTGKKVGEIAGPEGTLGIEGEVIHLAFDSDGQLLVFTEGLVTRHNIADHSFTSSPFPFKERGTRVNGSGNLLTFVEYSYDKHYSRVGFNVGILNADTRELVSHRAFDHVWGDVYAFVSQDQKKAGLLYSEDLRASLYTLPDWVCLNEKTDVISDAALEGVTQNAFVLICRDTARVTDRNGKLAASRSFPGEAVYCARPGPDGSAIIVTTSESRALVLSLPDLKDVSEMKVRSTSSAVAFSTDGTQALIGWDNGTLLHYSMETKKHTKLPQWMTAYTSQIRWSPDGKLALAADGTKAILFDVAKRKLISDELAQGEYTWAVDFSAAGDRVVVAGRDVSLRVLDLNGKELLRVPDIDTDRVWFMPDGRILVFQLDGSLLFMDGRSGTRIGSYHLRETSDCIFSVVPSVDRSEWWIKSSRGRLMQCVF